MPSPQNRQAKAQIYQTLILLGRQGVGLGVLGGGGGGGAEERNPG